MKDGVGENKKRSDPVTQEDEETFWDTEMCKKKTKLYDVTPTYCFLILNETSIKNSSVF